MPRITSPCPTHCLGRQLGDAPPQARQPRRPIPLRATLLLLTLLALPACHLNHPDNPAFTLDRHQARQLLGQMQANPKPLPRPVLVLGGWADPGFAAQSLKKYVRAISTDDQPVIAVSFFGVTSYKQAHQRVARAVRKELPTSHKSSLPAGERVRVRGQQTTHTSKTTNKPDNVIEVDVLAFSMGGIVARYIATNPHPAGNGETNNPPVKLKIVRLFTISTPHRGARMARFPNWDPLVHRLKPGTDFLHSLNGDSPHTPYQLHPYVRLGDGIVGARYAAPPGRTPWWVPTPPFGDGHNGARRDPRILADIARRLRREKPITTEPPPPLPEKYRNPETDKPTRAP